MSKWILLRHAHKDCRNYATRDTKSCLPLLAAHPEIEGDDTGDVHKTVATLRRKDALAAKINAGIAEREATRWYDQQKRREALFGEKVVAAQLVYATKKLMVYETIYAPVGVSVTYRKHRHAHAEHSSSARA